VLSPNRAGLSRMRMTLVRSPCKTSIPFLYPARPRRLSARLLKHLSLWDVKAAILPAGKAQAITPKRQSAAHIYRGLDRLFRLPGCLFR